MNRATSGGAARARSRHKGTPSGTMRARASSRRSPRAAIPEPTWTRQGFGRRLEKRSARVSALPRSRAPTRCPVPGPRRRLHVVGVAGTRLIGEGVTGCRRQHSDGVVVLRRSSERRMIESAWRASSGSRSADVSHRITQSRRCRCGEPARSAGSAASGIRAPCSAAEKRPLPPPRAVLVVHVQGHIRSADVLAAASRSRFATVRRALEAWGRSASLRVLTPF